MAHQSTSHHQADVTRFFDGYADDFHSIYGRQHASTFGGLVDRLTRQGMFRRFEETVRECRAVAARSLLDVGCGPGFHDAFLADKLGITIRGIDVAPRMIEIAERNAEARGVSSQCDFSTVDFMAFSAAESFDVVLALGVVEYIEEPTSFIAKMISHSRKRVLFSVPRKWHPLTPQRVLRYKLRRCPLHFYDRKALESLLQAAGAHDFEIKTLNRDYLSIIKSA